MAKFTKQEVTAFLQETMISHLEDMIETAQNALRAVRAKEDHLEDTDIPKDLEVPEGCGTPGLKTPESWLEDEIHMGTDRMFERYCDALGVSY